jgi:hypothetical protein
MWLPFLNWLVVTVVDQPFLEPDSMWLGRDFNSPRLDHDSDCCSVSDRSKGRREDFGSRLDRIRNRDHQASIAGQDSARTHHC